MDKKENKILESSTDETESFHYKFVLFICLISTGKKPYYPSINTLCTLDFFVFKNRRYLIS